VQDEVVAAGGGDAAGAAGMDAVDIDDIDDPPQAPNAAISKAHAAPANQ